MLDTREFNLQIDCFAKGTKIRITERTAVSDFFTQNVKVKSEGKISSTNDMARLVQEFQELNKKCMQ